VRLFELAYCCNLYSNEEYDRASLELHDATGPSVDPGNEQHVAPLFNWLRRWGCRQFAIGDEAVARASLVDWWSTWGGSLPPSELALDEVDDSGLDVIAGAYDDLRARQASWQRLPSGPVAKTFGPTGAAKTLYAIRPRSCSPWDDPIRKWLGVRVTAEGYRRHVVRIRDELAEAAADLGPGHASAQLPGLLGRAGSSPVKLVDEHDWVRYTRGFTVPSPEQFLRWAEWAAIVPPSSSSAVGGINGTQ
jgi:hypothetical protein